MKVSLVCVAKNEHKYIKDWFEWHKKFGFDTFYKCQMPHSSYLDLPHSGAEKYMKMLASWMNPYIMQWIQIIDVAL